MFINRIPIQFGPSKSNRLYGFPQRILALAFFCDGPTRFRLVHTLRSPLRITHSCLLIQFPDDDDGISTSIAFHVMDIFYSSNGFHIFHCTFGDCCCCCCCRRAFRTVYELGECQINTIFVLVAGAFKFFFC